MNTVEIQFKTKTPGTYDNTFNTMKKYQEAGLADKSSKIIFNDIEIPAGHYDNWEDSFKLYEALVSGDQQEIEEALPKDITKEDMFSIELSIAKTYKSLHNKELSSEYLDTLLNKVSEETIKKSI